MTRDEFADALKVKPGRIQAYENEGANAPDKIKAEIAKLFKVDLGKFLTKEMSLKNLDEFFIQEEGKSRIDELKENLDLKLKELRSKPGSRAQVEEIQKLLKEVYLIVDDLKDDLVNSYKRQREIVNRL